MEQLIHSAALYCQEESPGHVSVQWLEGALELLRSHGLRVCEYNVEENPICAGGTYAFRDKDTRLLNAVQTGTLASLYLYAHSKNRRDLIMDWEGAASIDLTRGHAHVGLPATCGVSLDELLRRTGILAKPLTRWRYGIGYQRSSLKAPSLYVVGMLGGAAYPYPDETEEDMNRVASWLRELIGARRHLKGHFREVYPANLLSTEHVNVRIGKNKTLLTAGWGAFTPLEDDMWNWTVPAEDIPKARAALLRAKVLLCP